jgi:SAM-dependent methyltransferase
MSGFSAEWLALREPADAGARADDLVDALRTALDPRCAILDLGAGTGANARHLAPRLGGEHAWTLVDHDAALLATLAASLPHELDWRALDRDLRDLAALPLPSRSLVTASALLDLVSAEWMSALAARCAKASAAALFVLSYDGRIAFDPPHPDDGRVRALVNRHQRTDKGFGPALGPDATDVAQDAFSARGYRCMRAASDWRLDSAHAPLQAALVEGWADAAIDVSPADAARIDAWRDARLAAAGTARLKVGHEDLLALPPMPATSQS